MRRNLLTFDYTIPTDNVMDQRRLVAQGKAMNAEEIKDMLVHGGIPDNIASGVETIVNNGITVQTLIPTAMNAAMFGAKFINNFMKTKPTDSSCVEDFKFGDG